MCASALAGYGASSPTNIGSQATEVPADTSAARDPAEATEAEKGKKETDSTVYGTPWLTSIVDGMVTEDLEKPDIKDDFFLSNNYEWLRDTKIAPDHIISGGIPDIEDMVNERLASLVTDESITGREANLVHEYYQMFLDWDNRAKGKDFFLEHLKPIQDIATLDDLTAYLTSEESMYYGRTVLEPSIKKT